MSSAIHCDRADCRTWAAAGYAADAGFLRVTWAGTPYDLCSVDCLLQFFAHVPPTVEVPND